MERARTRPVGLLALLCTVALLAGCAGALNLPDRGSRPSAYTVHRGDTLYSIAWHYGLDYHTVAHWNGISPPYTIYPGQRIRLRPGGNRSSGGGETSRAAVASKKASSASRQSSAPATKAGASGGAVDWGWPAKGQVESTFGQKGLVGKGILIDGKMGQPVRAAAAGTVVYSGGALAGYGRLIIVKHNDEWLSAYAHNQRLLVHEGERVKAGEKIATMGRGPEKAPALYFEIRRDGSPVNPLRFLPKAR